ncbi:MAG: hypothetical protein AAF727_02280 [Pseudomonadota bacterium]
MAATLSDPGDPALAGATIEGFDSATPGVASVLSLADVTVSVEGTGSFTVSEDAGAAVFAPPVSTGEGFLFSSNRTVVFTFDAAVSAFGFVLGVTNFAQPLTAFDSTGPVVASLITANQVGDGVPGFTEFYGLSSPSANIASFSLTSVDEGWVLDDLPYMTAAPLPASPLLLLGAFGGIAGLRRRRGHGT